VFNNFHEDGAKCLLLTNDMESEIEVGCLPVVKYLLLGLMSPDFI
jgi:hypothetical protein